MKTAKILFVDDEIDLKRLLKQRLKKTIRENEFELLFASNGKEALEILKSDSSVAMVATDINMPEMDGLTLLAKIAEIDPTIKTVVMSAYSDWKNIRTAMHCGAFDFLTKPIDFEDLVITIIRTLNQVQQVRENLNKLQHAQLLLIQSEKMSTLGQLVAGVAHEINNPIGFLSGNIEQTTEAINDLINHLRLYQEEFPNPGSEIEENAEEIDLEYLLKDLPEMLSSMKVGAERIRNISNSLRTFYRGDTGDKVLANIHEGMDSTLTILQHRLKANNERPAIQTIKEYGDIPPVKCYLGKLNQVFMNILVNAIDAIEESNQGKSFTEIEAAPNTIAIKTELSESDPSVVIKIKDNGKGISDEIKSKIFDQFFTTKSIGKGTGLGLSISRQIVEEAHGGSLTCSSVEGEGSEFTIMIPIDPS
ncbi:hybrid sensor histidine kinase/response regulator [Microseira wollei]|uniref:histidine kinase n=1 Tax=Microseira wollei NIES-4236 TaxID=2530354 RepID=A0AAV3WFW3_9CYAN|nr:response regulator [Microseira wollei]GET36999.1 two-component hybrid sensor and regulator [Microseira wollei NIES-4236]